MQTTTAGRVTWRSARCFARSRSIGRRPAAGVAGMRGAPASHAAALKSSQPRRAFSMVAMSILPIVIIASNARLAAARSGSVNASVRARGVICHDRPHLSLHQPHSLAWPPFGAPRAPRCRGTSRYRTARQPARCRRTRGRWCSWGSWVCSCGCRRGASGQSHDDRRPGRSTVSRRRRWPPASRVINAAAPAGRAGVTRRCTAGCAARTRTSAPRRSVPPIPPGRRWAPAWSPAARSGERPPP